MKKNFFFLITLFVMFAGCNNQQGGSESATSNSTPSPVSSPSAASEIPSFKMIDINGKAINLADFKGKKLFVNLWASWCPPCREEIPSIESLYSKTNHDKVAFVMLSLDEAFEAGIKFAQKSKMVSPVYHPAEDLPKLFQVQGIPATFIFNEQGKLITRMDGGDNYDTDKYLSLLQ